jgi:ATP-dependent DNA helicase DinG
VPLVDGLAEAAEDLATALHDLKRPMTRLAEALAKKLDDEAQELSTYDRGRIEAVSRSLKKRGELMVGGWIDMLARLLETKNPLFVEWFAIDQIYGREADVGLHSHWVEQTEPLALAVLNNADGVIITSATLKDRPPDVPDDWANAEMRTGAVHLPYPVKRVSYDSPFDTARAGCWVNDVNPRTWTRLPPPTANCFRQPRRGWGLFAFTARAVHKRLTSRWPKRPGAICTCGPDGHGNAG